MKPTVTLPPFGILPLKSALVTVTVVPLTLYLPLQPLDIAKPFGTENFAVQPFMLFPELLVMVSSAVPHFLPPSSHVFPAFHEKEMPLVGTVCEPVPEELFELEEELLELDEELPELEWLEELDELLEPDDPPELDVLLVLDGLSALELSDGSDVMSGSSPPTLPTSAIPGSE